MRKILLFILLSITLFAEIPSYETVGDIPKDKKPSIAAVAFIHKRTHNEIALVAQVDEYFTLIYADAYEMTQVVNNRSKKPINFNNDDKFGKWMTKDEMIKFLKKNGFKYHNYKEYLKK